MTTFNTGNPIGSTDARDRSDNSEFLDEVVNSLDLTKPDRFGRTRDTLEGIYQKSAYYRAGTFDAGYTLTNNRQTLAHGNVEYSWSGAFPKVVAAGSTPDTSGGVGHGAWVDRTDVALRSELLEGCLLYYADESRFVLRDIVSPLDFNKPTFTEQLQAAADYVSGLGGGTVIIPSGEFIDVGNVKITTRHVRILGRGRGETILKAASGVSSIFHFEAPNPGTSYINRYLDACCVSDMTLSGADADDHVTDGLYLQGVYNSHFHHLGFINLNRAALTSGMKDCHLYEWHDGDRQPLGTAKVNKIIQDVTPSNEYWNDNCFYNIHMHAKVGHFDFSDDSVPKDGCNIHDCVLFVNNTNLQYHIYLVRGLYSTIARNKFFESRGNGVILDSCSQMSFDANLVAIPGQSAQSVGIKVVNSKGVSGYGRNIAITNNIINRSSGDSIEISGIDGFTCTGNRSHWAGDQSYFTGQTWGSSVHIRIKSGSCNGVIANNSCGNEALDDPSAYSRASYDVLLESGSHNNIVDGQTPYYVHDNGTNNDVRCADWKTNCSTDIFDESARNLIRNHTRDMSGWTLGNTNASNPTVAYQSGTVTPTKRASGVSVVTFPDTTSGWSYVRASIGTTSMGYLGVTPVAGDLFIFSVFMKSNSGAMRKVTLSVGNNADTWRVDKVFNVGTTYKRYWMVAPWDGTTTSLFLAYIGMQQTFAGIIEMYGAKVELIQNSSYVRRQVPSPYDFLQIRYLTAPSKTNGGDAQVGDRFWNALPAAGASPGSVVTVEGANNLIFTPMPSI